MDVGNAFALYGLGITKAETRDWKSAKRNWERCLRCFESEHRGRREGIAYKLYQGNTWFSTLSEAFLVESLPVHDWILERRMVKQNCDVALIHTAAKRNAGLLSQEALTQVESHGLNGVPASIRLGPNWNVDTLPLHFGQATKKDLESYQVGFDAEETTLFESTETWPMDSTQPIEVPAIGSSSRTFPLQIARTWPVRKDSINRAMALSKPLPPVPAVRETREMIPQMTGTILQHLTESPSPVTALATTRTWPAVFRDGPGPPPTGPLPPTPQLQFTEDEFRNIAALRTDPSPPFSVLPRFRRQPQLRGGRIRLPSIPAVPDHKESSEPRSSSTLTQLLYEYDYSDESPTLGSEDLVPTQPISLDTAISQGGESPLSASSMETITPLPSSSHKMNLRLSEILLSPFVYTPFAVSDRLSYFFPDSGRRLIDEAEQGSQQHDEGQEEVEDKEKQEGATPTEATNVGTHDESAQNVEESNGQTNYDRNENLFPYEDDHENVQRSTDPVQDTVGEILLPLVFEGFSRQE